MLIVDLVGGLGNMLFQIASIYSLSKITGHTFKIGYISSPPKQHSKLNYRSNILKNFEKFEINIPTQVNLIIEEVNGLINLIPLSDKNINILFKGYFQLEMYIRPHRQEIINLLNFDNSILEKYPNLNNSYFLHIRRGDYIGNPYHELNLNNSF